jgi:ABC-type dipeptide/oligopeptide/nickel transport system permease component
MLKYIVGRVFAMLITLFIIVTLSFFVIRLMPQNIFDNPDLPPYVVEILEKKMHLDKPMYVQYYYFLRGIFLEGDFGTSVKIRPSLPVFQVLKSRLPISMLINVLSLFISIPIGITAGTIAALRKNKLPDHAVSLLVVLFISVPSFVFASLMQYGLTFLYPIFPTLYNPSATTLRQLAMSITLPVVALALNPIATVARYLRGELIETMSSEFLLLARTKGLTRAQAVMRHAFRNSCVPLVNIVIPMFTGIMGGSLVIESIFSIPGMGGMMISSINAGDHPLTIAILIFYSIISLVTMLIMDISYGLLDPRIRMGGRR